MNILCTSADNKLNAYTEFEIENIDGVENHVKYVYYLYMLVYIYVQTN